MGIINDSMRVASNATINDMVGVELTDRANE